MISRVWLDDQTGKKRVTMSEENTTVLVDAELIQELEAIEIAQVTEITEGSASVMGDSDDNVVWGNL